MHSCKDTDKNKKDTCNPYPDNCLLAWYHTIGKNGVDNLYQAELRGSISALDSMQINKDQFIHTIHKCMEMQSLTAPLLRELIDHIDVYETEGTGKNRTQRIMIHYKFVGVIKIPDYGDNYTADTRKGVAVEYVTQSA